MVILASAVLTASLLGSMHCVGMCGPLALWATGASEHLSKTKLLVTTGCYHGGRLVTYVIAGMIAGSLGRLLDLGGQAMGFSLMAARLIGLVMVIVGVHRLLKLFWPIQRTPITGNSPTTLGSRINLLLLRIRPKIVVLPVPLRSLVVGLLSALMPCGWLYLFALFAAATGNVASGVVVMSAFWLGTVPALVAIVAGTRILHHRFTTAIPLGVALLLVVSGCYTASGRGFARLGALDQLHESVRRSTSDAGTDVDQQLKGLTKTPLPCCEP